MWPRTSLVGLFTEINTGFVMCSAVQLPDEVDCSTGKGKLAISKCCVIYLCYLAQACPCLRLPGQACACLGKHLQLRWLYCLLALACRVCLRKQTLLACAGIRMLAQACLLAQANTASLHKYMHACASMFACLSLHSLLVQANTASLRKLVVLAQACGKLARTL